MDVADGGNAAGQRNRKPRRERENRRGLCSSLYGYKDESRNTHRVSSPT